MVYQENIYHLSAQKPPRNRVSHGLPSAILYTQALKPPESGQTFPVSEEAIAIFLISYQISSGKPSGNQRSGSIDAPFADPERFNEAT